ncbi:MAG: VWA domain-containing protein [Candidatus Aminicenantes bacterium]|nr:VWA domain-containing protein [Candidatus Aminicenantes bacterium]
MKDKVAFPVIALAAVSLALGASPTGQKVKPEQEEALQHEVTVTLKLIQVFVTDKNGRPVTDLEKSDFVLYDSGRRQTITDFERHKRAAARPSEALVETPAGQPAPLLNRKFFFLFDLRQNDVLGIQASRKAALEFIDVSLQPTDEVGLLTISEIKGIQIHQFLTNDHAKVRQMIEKIFERAEVPGAGVIGQVIRDTESSDDAIAAQLAERTGGEKAQTSADAPPPGGGQTTTQSTTMSVVARPGGGEGDFYMQRTYDLTKNMGEVAKALRLIPGAKNVIFFSGGYARGLYEGNKLFRGLYNDMAQQFGNAAAPVFTVNAMGSRQQTRRPAARSDLTLGKFSELSGGAYFEDVTQAVQIARRIDEATGNYYVLGYPIRGSRDGAFHEVKVEVKRPGCSVAVQSGYYNPRPFAKMSAFEKEFHLLDLALNADPQGSTPLPLPLLALDFPPRAKTKESAVLVGQVAPEEVREVMGDRLEIATLVFDRANFVAYTSRGTIDLALVKARTFFPYCFMDLGPGEYEARLVLRNLETGLAAVGRTSIAVRPPVTAPLTLYPPLLLESRDGQFLRMKKTKGEPGASELNLGDVYRFVAEKHAPLFDAVPKETREVLAVVPVCTSGTAAPEVNFDVFFVSEASGATESLELELLAQETRGQEHFVLVRVTLPEMRTGRHALRFVATEAATGARGEIERQIRVY